jgi:hypothetical protein
MRMAMGRILGGVLAAAALGCVGPTRVPVPSLEAGQPERRIERSYIPGVARTVRIGEVLAGFKEDWMVPRYPGHLLMNQQFTITTGHRRLILPLGRVLTCIGPVSVDGQDCIAYRDLHGDDGIAEIYYMRPDFTLAPWVYVRDRANFPQGMERVLEIWPRAARFPGQPASGPAAGRPGRQVEVLFQGRDEQGIHLVRQETSGEGANRTEALEPLDFPANAGELRVGDLRIAVRACGEDWMEAAVVAD